MAEWRNRAKNLRRNGGMVTPGNPPPPWSSGSSSVQILGHRKILPTLSVRMQETIRAEGNSISHLEIENTRLGIPAANGPVEILQVGSWVTRTPSAKILPDFLSRSKNRSDRKGRNSDVVWFCWKPQATESCQEPSKASSRLPMKIQYASGNCATKKGNTFQASKMINHNENWLTLFKDLFIN